MKHLATYMIFVIVMSALALSGNKIFYTLANAYNYLIYGVVGVIAIGVLAYNFMPKQNG